MYLSARAAFKGKARSAGYRQPTMAPINPPLIKAQGAQFSSPGIKKT